MSPGIPPSPLFSPPEEGRRIRGVGRISIKGRIITSGKTEETFIKLSTLRCADIVTGIVIF